MQMKAALLSILISTLFASAPSVHAAQLGKITVTSKPDQPFAAEIQIDRMLPGERDSLKVGLAPAESFAAARLTMDPNLSKLKFSIKEGAAPGSAVVQISATENLPAGFMDALFELSWAGGKVTREYTLSIPLRANVPAVTPQLPQVKSTPPADKPVAPVVEPPKKPVVEAPKPTDAPKKAPTEPVKPSDSAAKPAAIEAPPVPAPTPAPAAEPAKVDQTTPKAAVEFSGKRKVRTGDTLSQIAAELTGQGVSLNQAMAAIYEANPDAFIKGSIHLLKNGAELRLPNRSSMKLKSRDEALVVLAQGDDRNDFALVAKQRGLLNVTQQAAKPAASSAGKIEDKPGGTVQANSGNDRLKISPGAADADGKAKLDKAAEELTAKEKALAEANERIALLEKNVSDLQKLLEMQQKQGAGVPVAGATTPPSEDKPVEKPTEGVTGSTQAAEPPPAAPVEPEAVQPKVEVEAPPAPVEPEKPIEKEAAPLWKNPWVLGGAGAVLLGGGGLAAFLIRRRKKQAEQAAEDEQSAESFSEALAWASAASGEPSANSEPQAPILKPQEEAVPSVGERIEDEVFDLDEILAEEPAPTVPPTQAPTAAPVAEPSAPAIDLNFDNPEADQQAEVNSIFEDLDQLEQGAQAAQREIESLRDNIEPTRQESDEKVDVDAAFEEFVKREPAAAQSIDNSMAAEVAADAFDKALGELDLDLPTSEVDQATWQEVATKLDLASAYIEIGDAEGASELLKEIVDKGDAEQVKKAQEMLAGLK